jgi:hypothetical protein
MSTTLSLGDLLRSKLEVPQSSHQVPSVLDFRFFVKLSINGISGTHFFDFEDSKNQFMYAMNNLGNVHPYFSPTVGGGTLTIVDSGQMLRCMGVQLPRELLSGIFCMYKCAEKVMAIKLLREYVKLHNGGTNCGLKEAKDFCDAWFAFKTNNPTFTV